MTDKIMKITWVEVNGRRWLLEKDVVRVFKKYNLTLRPNENKGVSSKRKQSKKRVTE